MQSVIYRVTNEYLNLITEKYGSGYGVRSLVTMVISIKMICNEEKLRRFGLLKEINYTICMPCDADWPYSGFFFSGFFFFFFFFMFIPS